MKIKYAPPSVSGATHIFKVGSTEVLVMVFDNGRITFATKKAAAETWSKPIPAERTGRF